jgi:hypothetical protein
VKAFLHPWHLFVFREKLARVAPASCREHVRPAGFEDIDGYCVVLQNAAWLE